MAGPILLTGTQRRHLLSVLGHFAPPVTRVDVYGSRADGSAHPGSDIDLILAGTLDDAIVARIASALSDSYLSIFADVTAYSLLSPGAFAEEVRRHARPLFDEGEMATALPYRPVEGLLSWYDVTPAPEPEARSHN